MKVENFPDANAEVLTGLFLINVNRAVTAGPRPKPGDITVNGIAMSGLFFHACVWTVRLTENRGVGNYRLTAYDQWS